MNDLMLKAAWCQINTEHGYRYLDDAGKVMNAFAEDFPELAVGLEGLSMKAPGAKLEEVRVSTTAAWASFDRPDTLQYVVDQSWRVFKVVVELIGVQTASRFGMRMHYLRPVDGQRAERLGPELGVSSFYPRQSLASDSQKTSHCLLRLSVKDLEAGLLFPGRESRRRNDRTPGTLSCSWTLTSSGQVRACRWPASVPLHVRPRSGRARK